MSVSNDQPKLNNEALKTEILKNETVKSKVIVALDFCDSKALFNFTDQLEPSLCRLKIGKELFTQSGPQIVRTLSQRGFDIFLDLKFHDIPNTVAKAIQVATDLGVWMVDIHASGGERMISAARSALGSAADRPLLIAVTVLTSFTESDLKAIGVNTPLADQVKNLATMAKNSGCDGVVCSAHEANMLRSSLGAEFKLVTPGIRLTTEIVDDQRRIMTPEAAIQAGSDYLVIGRAITNAKDPVALLIEINQKLKVKS